MNRARIGDWIRFKFGTETVVGRVIGRDCKPSLRHRRGGYLTVSDPNSKRILHVELNRDEFEVLDKGKRK